MLNSRLILIVACLVAATTAATVNETTNCPLNTEHKCEFCAYDSNRYGCYCDDTELVTADIFTPCSTVDVEPCSPNPCKNGGSCTRTGLTDYKCDCASGFGGATCETTLPKCGDPGIQCLNSECVNTGHADLPVYCQCFDGSRRDPRGNDTCPQSPCYETNTNTPICKNDATCQIYNSAPVCQCKEGFAGQVCDKSLKTPLCSSNPNACGVGKCQQSLTPPFYSCYCGNYPSTFGKTLADLVKCEESACYLSNPCLNGGTCSNKAGGAFSCQCPSQYTGFRCEKQSACYNNPCQNNGICEAFNETAYFCTCPAYFTGKQCETVVPNPCIGKNCGPHGTCQDSAGVALCKCSNGLQSDGSLCEDPCTNLNCNTGVCATKINATYEAYCACPVTRKGEHCELPNDVCREKPPCGGGYCKTNYAAPNGYSCVCEGAVIKNQPCGFHTSCPIKNCGTQGLCVQTDGLIVPPATLPIHYVCSCLKGYITNSDCNGLLADLTTYDNICGNGKAYPSRNPNIPVGCWCNNGTHVPEIELSTPVGVCI